MSVVLEASFNGVESMPMFSKARRRWRLVYTAVYSTRALLSLVREILAKKLILRTLSYTTVSVEQSSLKELVEEKILDQLSDQVEGLVSAIETNAESGIRGDAEDIVFEASFDGVELVPNCSKAQRRWRRVYTTVYSSRALLSLVREMLAKKFLRTPSYTVVNVEPDHFSGISQSSLKQLVGEKNLEWLQQLGGVEGVVSALETDAENGIQGNAEDITCRHENFGSNSYQRPPAKTLHVVMDVVLDAFKDPIILILLVCGVLSLGYGIKKHGWKGGSDGGSILAAVFLVVAVSVSSNFWPKKQFNKLSQACDNTQVDVTRNGRPQQIPIFKVVVGDVVQLKAGDQVPADGLFLDGLLQVDESNMKRDSDPVEVNHTHNPFLLSGTKVADGQARMLVTSVGMNTEWGQIMSSISCDERTPLQAKLKNLTLFTAKVGVVVAFLVLVVLLIRYFKGNMHDDTGNKDFTSGKTNIHDVCNAVIGILATPVAIAAAAIPEGLLLAVMVTLAYSTKRMLANQALVRKLSACEAMGSVTVICTDRKGTLTMNHMNVSEFWLGQQDMKEGASASIAPKVLELLHQGVGLNATQHPSGSLPELVLRVEAFNSETKRSGVLIRKKADKTIHVHQKGAPELILAMCSHYHTDNGVIKDINNGARETFQQVIQGMETNGLQCIVFAHRQLSQDYDDDGKIPAKLEEDGLILLGLVGLKDPCRPGVREAVIDCQNSGVNIKMITGDDMSTAKAIATECGILEPNQDITTGDVVEGLAFGNYTHEERMEKVERISVIARASYQHKLLMVQCLKQKGHVVAVTGDGTGDAVVFRAADVGLGMGIQGTNVAKESSDVVILDNNFLTVVEVLRWGRGIYINIRTFTQFQFTVSIASLVIDLVTAISAGEPPTINIVAAISAGTVPYATLQLLWVKLIVGTLASLALTIEQPTKEVMQMQTVNSTEPFITNIMWRNMLAQALYQIAILLTIQFHGESIFHVNVKVKDTLIFNTFVLFQIFMILNARKFEKNVVEGIKRKKLFWGIIGITIVLQVVMVELLKRFAHTERLNWGQWGASFGIAAVSWPIGWLIKYIPVPEKPCFSFLRWPNLNYRHI